jgi:signal transduction histidine kinase
MGEAVAGGAWRKRILRSVSWIVFVGGALVLAAWVTLRGTFVELPSIAMGVVLAQLGIGLGARVRDDLLALKLITAMAMASTFALSAGLLAGPLLCATGAAVAAAAFLGRRSALFVLAGISAMLVAGGFAITRGYLPTPEATASDPLQWNTWLRAALVFGVAAGAMAALVDGVVRSLEQSLTETASALEALRNEQAMRLSADEQRRRAEHALAEAAKFEAIGRLAGGTAHDFNNYLTVIQGWVDLLRIRAWDASTRDALDAIENARKQAGQLTSQLLALGRPAPGNPTPIEVAREVTQLAKSWERVLPGGVKLVVEASTQGKIAANETELQQVLLNLVLNARDALPPTGGTITVRARDVTASDAPPLHTRRDGPYVAVTVADNGAGLPESVRPHIFEPFFTTKGERGSGLGLAMVWLVMQRLGGAVSVESQPGDGSAFTLFFPAL